LRAPPIMTSPPCWSPRRASRCAIGPGSRRSSRSASRPSWAWPEAS